MPGPRFKDDELVQCLNQITTLNKVTLADIKSPNVDSTTQILISVLKESGFLLSSNNLYNLCPPDSIVSEYQIPIQLMVTARKFFDDLAAACDPNSSIRFGIEDILSPEPKRFKYFLGHFVNYWLFCNSQYDEYSKVDEEANGLLQKGEEYRAKIDDYKRKNAELRKSKATAAMKAEKLKAKIAQDEEKMASLTNQAQALAIENDQAKRELAEAKEEENDRDHKVKDLEKAAFKLKTIAKADETKQELENLLETLKNQEEEKLYEMKNLEHKIEALIEQESVLKDDIASLQVTKDQSLKKKSLTNEKKSLMADCDVAHEKLETNETQLLALQRELDALKKEIAGVKSKWSKNKGMMEADITSYTEQLSNMTKAMTEDDMVNHEMDSKISDIMMSTEELREQITKEEDAAEKAMAIMERKMHEFMAVMRQDHEALGHAWEEMKNLKRK